MTAGRRSVTVSRTSAEAMLVPSTLAAHACFKTLDPEACHILDRQCVWLKIPSGAWIVDQSAHDRDVYFIMSGHMRSVLNMARQYGPYMVMLLGVLIAAVPVMGMWAEQNSRA